MSRKLLISVIVGHFVLCFLSYYLLVNNYGGDWLLNTMLLGLVVGSPISFILLVVRGTKETTYKKILLGHLKAFGILVLLMFLAVYVIKIEAIFWCGLFLGFLGLPGIVMSCILQLIICFMENRCKCNVPEGEA